jgi:hypothetical protein
MELGGQRRGASSELGVGAPAGTVVSGKWGPRIAAPRAVEVSEVGEGNWRGLGRRGLKGGGEQRILRSGEVRGAVAECCTAGDMGNTLDRTHR